jgi:hypothetical protein
MLRHIAKDPNEHPEKCHLTEAGTMARGVAMRDNAGPST